MESGGWFPCGELCLVTDLTIVQLVRDTFITTLMVVAPILLISMIVGLTISITQVVTSIQDPTLSFVPRMLSMVIVVLVLISWMVERVTAFTTQLFSELGSYIQ